MDLREVQCKSAKFKLILREVNPLHIDMICHPRRNNIQPGSGVLSFEIFYSVKDLSPAEWNKIAKDKIFLQYDYLQALENSKPAGISFYYVFIYENKIPKAICYFQIADLISKELGSIINFENYGEILNAVGNKINSFLLSGKRYTSKNLLVCGSLFVSGEYGIACAEEKYFSKVFAILPKIIESITEKINKEGGKVIAVSIKDFYTEEDKHAGKLVEEKFHRMVIDPNMIFNVRSQWKTFDDYLNAMSSKYRIRANNVIDKLAAAQIKYLDANAIEKEKENIERLYHNVQKKAPVRIVNADTRYFLELKKQLKDKFVFRAFYLENKMIAFTSGFKQGKHYEAHFIGIDYHYNKSHALYQNILYDFIHEAIKSKCRELVFGRTAMEIKSTVGAVAYPLFSYLKLSNHLLNKIVKPFIPSEENKNWIARSPFKEE